MFNVWKVVRHVWWSTVNQAVILYMLLYILEWFLFGQKWSKVEAIRMCLLFLNTRKVASIACKNVKALGICSAMHFVFEKNPANLNYKNKIP